MSELRATGERHHFPEHLTLLLARERLDGIEHFRLQVLVRGIRAQLPENSREDAFKESS